jgi:hypothetical protein|nr:MAG TPA: helix-turn-helix domain protein [Caudoviricetes sp.]
MRDIKISLAAARVNAHLTQREVAKRLGVTTNTIVAWEKNRREPSVTQAKVLAETYGMPFDSIIFFRASNNLELINEGTE